MPHSSSGSTSLVRSPKRHAPPSCRKTYMHARSTRSLDVFGQSRVNDGRFQQPIQAGRFEKTNAKVKAFLDWPYLLMDATYVKVRQSGRKARPALVPARRDVGDLRRPHAPGYAAEVPTYAAPPSSPPFSSKKTPRLLANDRGPLPISCVLKRNRYRSSERSWTRRRPTCTPS